MKRYLAPDLTVASILDISPELLDRHGIRGLILDADNTLVPRQQYALDHAVTNWIRRLQDHGRRLCILSNSGHVRKVAGMVAPFEMAAISLARKPFPSGFRRALTALGTTARETAMVGDQMLTDILGGNLAGMLTIMVEPLSTNDFIGYRLMRPLERRLMRRWSMPVDLPVRGED